MSVPLSGQEIPGCITPRGQNADPKNLDELKAECGRFDRWPLIVRARGKHGGKDMLLLDEPGQLAIHKDETWLYEGICLIEFVDYKGPDGLYQKNRAIIVDGRVYPRRATFFEHWLVHAGSRFELMSQDICLCNTEQQFLSNGLQEHLPVFQQIYERIGLDVFGVDFAIVSGQIVVFEANACMKFLGQRLGDDNRFEYLEAPLRAIKRALKKMLMQA